MTAKEEPALSTAKAYYTSSEVAKMLGMDVSTLRVWENQITHLNPKRSDNGHRMYSEQDVTLCLAINDMIHRRGMKLGQIEVLLNHIMRKPQPRYVCSNSGEALALMRDILPRISSSNREARERMAAVIKWLESLTPQPDTRRQ